MSAIPSYRVAETSPKENASYAVLAHPMHDQRAGGHKGWITWNGSDQLSPEAKTRNAGLVRDVAARELILSGSQLVVGCVCSLGRGHGSFVGPFQAVAIRTAVFRAPSIPNTKVSPIPSSN